MIKTWILSIAGIIILSAMLSLILPEGKAGKLIKSILALLVILVIIKPLFSIFSGGEVSFMPENQTIVTEQQNFIDYINGKKIESYKTNTEQILKNHGVYDAQIEIIVLTDNDINEYTNEGPIIQKIIIDLKNSVIKSDSPHKDIIKDLKKDLAEYFSLSQEKIEIYE